METQKELGAQRKAPPRGKQNEKEVLTEKSTSVVCKINSIFHNIADNIKQFVSCVKDQAHKDIDSFRAGQIKHHFQKWTELTSDSEIVQMVSGYKLQFEEMPCQTITPSKIVFTKEY